MIQTPKKLKKIGLNILIITMTLSIILFMKGYDKFLSPINKPPITEIMENKKSITNPVTTDTIAHTGENLKTNNSNNVIINWSKISIDKVEVYKSKRRLDLLDGGKIIKSYPMKLGFQPLGHKTTEGDGKTPEGKYTIDWRNPQSKFYLSLHISYPNKQDLAQAKVRGVSAGGDIMIHGSAKKSKGSQGQSLYDYLPKKDWTWGCVAMSNKDMDEIWENVKNGTDIEIFK